MPDPSDLEARAERQATRFVSTVIASMPNDTPAELLERVTGIARIGFTSGYLTGYSDGVRDVRAIVREHTS